MDRWLITLLTLLVSGCTVKQQLLSLDATSRLGALGRQLLTERCGVEKDACLETIRTKKLTTADCPKLDACCPRLKDCEVAEKHVYAAVGVLQITCETAGALIKAGGTSVGKGTILLAEALRRLKLIQDILAIWGVQL